MPPILPVDQSCLLDPEPGQGLVSRRELEYWLYHMLLGALVPACGGLLNKPVPTGVLEVWSLADVEPIPRAHVEFDGGGTVDLAPYRDVIRRKLEKSRRTGKSSDELRTSLPQELECGDTIWLGTRIKGNTLYVYSGVQEIFDVMICQLAAAIDCGLNRDREKLLRKVMVALPDGQPRTFENAMSAIQAVMRRFPERCTISDAAAYILETATLRQARQIAAARAAAGLSDHDWLPGEPVDSSVHLA